MGRGRTHAVVNRSKGVYSTNEIEEDLQEGIAKKMNLGMDKDDLIAVNDRIDGRQVTRPDDINVKCSEENRDRVECIVAVVAAEVVEPPWELTQILIAVAMASAFAGFFGDYFAAREYEVLK